MFFDPEDENYDPSDDPQRDAFEKIAHEEEINTIRRCDGLPPLGEPD